MPNKTTVTAEPGKQELYIIREFNAPRELLFKAHTDPGLYGQWVGPHDLTMTVEHMDAVDGGSYRFVHERGGHKYAFHGVYHEVLAPERIIGTFEFDGLPEKGHVIMGTTRFEDLGVDAAAWFISQSFSRLRTATAWFSPAWSGALTTVTKSSTCFSLRTWHEDRPHKEMSNVNISTPTDREVVLTRQFDASPDLVFRALTTPELVIQWCCPEGWTFDVCDIDRREGGNWRFQMSQPSGKQIGQFGVYRELVPGERLVNTEAWEDWDAGETLVTTVLKANGTAATSFTSTILFPSKEVRDIVLKSGLEHSVGPMYDKLADVLASASVL